MYLINSITTNFPIMHFSYVTRHMIIYGMY